MKNYMKSAALLLMLTLPMCTGIKKAKEHKTDYNISEQCINDSMANYPATFEHLYKEHSFDVDKYASKIVHDFFSNTVKHNEKPTPTWYAYSSPIYKNACKKLDKIYSELGLILNGNVEFSRMLGDADNNGKITKEDAKIVSEIVSGAKEKPLNIKHIDTNKNNILESMDVQYIINKYKKGGTGEEIEGIFTKGPANIEDKKRGRKLFLSYITNGINGKSLEDYFLDRGFSRWEYFCIAEAIRAYPK